MNTESRLEHTANGDQLAGREEILRLFNECPMSDVDQLFNLGCYVRSGLLVKFLLLADLYRRAMPVPGLMLEAGVWYGQNLVLLENLRAIFEPFNKERRIVGFDTFEGYQEGKYQGSGIYNTGPQHAGYLDRLLQAHARANVYGHQPCPHELVVGDITQKAPAFFRENAAVTVSLAILDMGPYEPTRALLEEIKPRLLPGSLVLLDEFTLQDTPGEAKAWLDVMGTKGYRLERLPLYPSKTVAEVL